MIDSYCSSPSLHKVIMGGYHRSHAPPKKVPDNLGPSELLIMKVSKLCLPSRGQPALFRSFLPPEWTCWKENSVYKDDEKEQGVKSIRALEMGLWVKVLAAEA